MKSILVRCDESLFNSIHKLMGYQIEVDGVIVYRVHCGKSSQEFYRKLLQLGIGVVQAQYEEELRKRERKDNY